MFCCMFKAIDYFLFLLLCLLLNFNCFLVRLPPPRNPLAEYLLTKVVFSYSIISDLLVASFLLTSLNVISLTLLTGILSIVYKFESATCFSLLLILE